MTFPNPHAQIDSENRERDRRLAALIRRNPDVLALARRNLKNWAARWGGLTPAWEEWEQLLRMLSPAQIADFLESTTPKANRLRQSSPFPGVLEETNNHVGDVTARCLEIHDLIVTKLAAGRLKDYEFIAAVLMAKLGTKNQVMRRIQTFPDPHTQAVLLARLRIATEATDAQL